jgi:hypothetical protein
MNLLKFTVSIVASATVTLIAMPLSATTPELQAAYCTQNWDEAAAIARQYQAQAQASDPTAAAQWLAYAEHMAKYAEGSLFPSADEIAAMGCTTGADAIVDSTDQNCGITTADGRHVSLDFCNQPGANNPAVSPANSTATTPAYTGNCRYAWQLDAAGRRCGKRAADQKPGGY